MNMSVENIDNNSDKHLLPDVVIVKRISNQSKNLKNGFQVSPRKYPAKEVVWASIWYVLVEIPLWLMSSGIITFIIALVIMSSSPTVVLFNPALVQK